MIDVSLIIPTHDRADSLERAIRSAADQELSPERYEIIVVDNASLDNTARVVERCQKELKSHHCRYVLEERLGLQHARHAGASVASGSVLVFTDDDATFDAGWLSAYVRAFDEHPEMAAAGGPVKPVWEEPPPEWLRSLMGDEKVFPMLSLVERHDELRIGPSEYFYGVNMAIRRDVLFAAGGFHPEAVGKEWLGDGETGLNRRLHEEGHPVGYVPEALVYHHIPSRRMTVEYLCHRMANEGACDVYAHFRNGIAGRRGLLRYAGSVALRHGGTWLRALLVNGRKDPDSLAVRLEAARTRSRFRYALRLAGDQRLRAMVLEDRWL